MSVREPPRSINPIFNPNTFDPTTSGASVVVDTTSIQDSIDAINATIDTLGTIYTFDISNSPVNLANGGTTYSTALNVPTGTYLMTAIFNTGGSGGNIFTVGTIQIIDNARTQTYTCSGVQPNGSRASNGLMSFLVTKTTTNPIITYNFNFKVAPGGANGTYFMNNINTPTAYIPYTSIRMLQLA